MAVDLASGLVVGKERGVKSRVSYETGIVLYCIVCCNVTSPVLECYLEDTANQRGEKGKQQEIIKT